MLDVDARNSAHNLHSRTNSLTNTYIRASERSSNSSKMEEYGNAKVTMSKFSEDSEQTELNLNLLFLKQNFDKSVSKFSPTEGKDGYTRQ